MFLSPIFLPFPSVMAALLRIMTNISSSNHLLTMRYLLPRTVITPEYLRLFLPISSFRDSFGWRFLSYFPWHFNPHSYDIWREYHSYLAKSNAKMGTIAMGVKIE